MLSTRGGRLRIWVWERETGRLFAVDDHSPSLQTPGRPFEWRSDRSIAFTALEPGTEVRRTRTRWSTPMLARRAWDQIAAGHASVSVLSSGESSTAPDGGVERDELRLVDIGASEASRTILRDSLWNLAWAPVTGNIAYARRVRLAPGPTATLREVAFEGRWQVSIARSDGTPFASVPSMAIDPRTLRWDPLGRELAFVGRPTNGEQRALIRFSTVSGQFSSCGPDVLDLGPEGSDIGLQWAAGGALLVRAGATGSSPDAKGWRVVRADCRVTVLGGADRVADLLGEPDGRHFIGLRDGRLVRFDVEGSPARLAERLGPIDRVVLQVAPDKSRREQETMLLVRTASPPRGRFALVAPGTGEIANFGEVRGEPLALDPARRMLVVYSNDRDGLRLAQYWPDGRSRILAEGNSFRQEISSPRMMTVRYRADDGSPSQAMLLLPERLRAQTRYPLIVWVYGGLVVDADVASELTEDFETWQNPRLATNQGFAVLIPSIPLGPEGVPGEPCDRIRATVESAARAAVDTGIVDADRSFLIGHSYGGYSVYCTITGATRFRAAVASAAVSNLISNYGQFSGDERYSDDPQRSMYFPRWTELGQGRMGGSPWQDPGRYLRNSPIHRAACINTPVMIVHGDLDFVPIQQAEEMFTALYRQAKRADLVRYWGEDHNLSQPANIRDYWRRVFAWFDEQGDIARDDRGNILFDGDHARVRREQDAAASRGSPASGSDRAASQPSPGGCGHPGSWR